MVSYSEFREIAHPSDKMERDSTLTEYYRRVSVVISYVLAYTPITANGVTVLSILSGVVGSLLILDPRPQTLLVGAILLHLYYVFDCCDGEIARYRRWVSQDQTRNFSGDYVDHLGHLIVQPLTVFCFGAGLINTFPALSVGTGAPLLLVALFASRPANNAIQSTLFANLSRDTALMQQPVFQSLVDKRIGLAENRLGEFAPRRMESLASHLLLLPGTIFQVTLLAIVYSVAALLHAPEWARWVHLGLTGLIYVGLIAHFLRTTTRNFHALKAHGIPKAATVRDRAHTGARASD